MNRVHFIAIGGSAMHNLALALHQKGYKVTGSDNEVFEPSKTRLEKAGLLPKAIGWFAENITEDIDAVILGMHAKEDNPELAKAKELGLKIYSYPEYLYEQSKNKKRVVIAGSHGKTTITSMILHVLDRNAIEIDYMVGAQLEGFDTMVKLTDTNDVIVLEGDEYLASPIDRRSKFLLYKPDVALISGVAWDHINVFTTFNDYKEQFISFIESINPEGILIYNEEDKEVVSVVNDAKNTLTRKAYKTPSYEIKDERVYLKTTEGEVGLMVFGRHNIQNLEGARLICEELGVKGMDFYKAISTFGGASKRLEKIVEKGSTVVYKDFAHAPSKVKATVSSVKENYKNKTLVGCLELHTYSSLDPKFLVQYKDTLKDADIKIVFYSKHALEIKGKDQIAESFIKECFNDDSVLVFTEEKGLEAYLKNLNKINSVFLMMSSGNYGGIKLEEIFN